LIICPRYVEMLEQQQVWLVNGLQELYRRAQDNEGWTGEALKLEPNGHPLTHDLLTRLGALDHTKGEHFEENPETMQQDLWRQNNAGFMQRQESSDGSSDVAHSPINNETNNKNNNNRGSRFADAFSRHQLPPTPPSYSPSSRTQQLSVKAEAQTPIMPTLAHNNQGFAMPQHDGVNPMALQQQGGQQGWTGGNELNSFDDIDMLGNQYTLFDDQIQATGASPMYGRQMSINCLPPSMLFDPNDDFNQYFNPNTEIPSL
jgi:hypothetical protein